MYEFTLCKLSMGVCVCVCVCVCMCVCVCVCVFRLSYVVPSGIVNGIKVVHPMFRGYTQQVSTGRRLSVTQQVDISHTTGRQVSITKQEDTGHLATQYVNICHLSLTIARDLSLWSHNSRHLSLWSHNSSHLSLWSHNS